MRDQRPDGQLKLYYRQPAARWDEALPIGNGRLGAMIFGHPVSERLQLNEDSLWYGGPRDRHNPDAPNHLADIRRLILAGRLKEAERLAALALTGIPETQRHYVALGDLFLRFAIEESHVTHYERELDLSEAVVRVAFRADAVNYRREMLASHPDGAIVILLTADAPGRISFTARLGRENFRYVEHLRTEGGRMIVMSGNSGGGVDYCGVLACRPEGGRMQTIGEHLVVEEADAVTLVVAATTSYRDQNPEAAAVARAEHVVGQSYDRLKSSHREDYQSLFNRTSLRLRGGSREKEDFSEAQDTAERMERMKAGAEDPALMALYYQYGRYLLISSSRPGSLPANLQGIWNKDMLPAWDSKYTININAQMNYWPAELCNLSECHEPLFDLIERLAENGRRTAQFMYGCRGSAAHHNTDIWADTAPQDLYLPATYWPLGLAWLSLHLWERYLFARDDEFLRRTYPIMKEAAVFLLDYMVELPTGELVTCPSVSPENEYRLPNGETGVLCYGPSMDSQIARELFSACLEAEDRLKLDPEFAASLKAAMDKLPEPRIGRHGQLQEWLEDYDEVEPGHRHISHLFALYPGTQIAPRATPNLSAAARRTLERRLANGGGHTGWSRAWIVNFWARLEDAEEAYSNVKALLTHSTLPNLLDNHPPFQIDGNFGGAAGIAEMLLQSHADAIHLLPALPKAWPDGEVSGLRARGAVTVDIAWQEGRLSWARLKPDRGGGFRLRCDVPISATIAGAPLEPERFDDGTCFIKAAAGDEVIVRLQTTNE
ncbi:glycoside hydrolase family 95 protein [Cohnella panacarvi]|uniref:glycoside hydrolase family 95 protein n=1 Tax=Cohnella panacarvi TaxID=400776 RepID=UPI000479A309|nr:glycoside hydrolase family 95 protein [Cohnella panacarvi]